MVAMEFNLKLLKLLLPMVRFGPKELQADCTVSRGQRLKPSRTGSGLQVALSILISTVNAQEKLCLLGLLARWSSDFSDHGSS